MPEHLRSSADFERTDVADKAAGLRLTGGLPPCGGGRKRGVRAPLPAHQASGTSPTVMEPDELERRIRLAEDPTLELKRVLLAGSHIMAPKYNEFADELAAMANGWGGTTVLGVEDGSAGASPSVRESVGAIHPRRACKHSHSRQHGLAAVQPERVGRFTFGTRCPVTEHENLVRSHLMDRRGEGVPIILDESRELSGRVPEYTLLDDSELRLVIWSAGQPESSAT